MKALIIEPTEKTPSVILDPENNCFEISGKSIPKDAESFYAPILEWLDSYIQNPKSSTSIKLDLEFFNIASSKRLLFVLYKLNELIEKNCDVAIKWCYKHNDDDMLEVGQDYAFMVKIPFEFVTNKPELELAY